MSRRSSGILMTFLWTNVISLPTMTTAGNHTYFAVEKTPWVPSLNINYILGVDELSVVLVFLNALLTPLALAISWDEHHRVPAFFALFLFMETTINGVFLSLDLFQFFVFWEVGLIPMYFLIAVWGGPRKKYAAIKFFMYTFLASLPLLVAIFAFYFYSSPHTFDMTRIIDTMPIPAGTIGDLMFVALLIAFGTKLPTWPLHTWLPDAHVEAPTGGSVILAGVLLKLGGYGLIRFNVQMIPQAAIDMYWLLALAGVISILYGAVVCLAQDDLKRMVAFSSVSHMGFVTLGIAAGVYGFTISGRGAVLGLTGAIFQMFAHGLVSAALFMVAGSLGHKIGTRNISELGGIAKRAPRIATFMMISFMASLGLPGLVGFVAEFSVFLGIYAAFGLLVFVPILTVILTAAYYIWAMQRAIFGPPNPKWEAMPDLHRFEVAPLAVLVAAFAVFGIVPGLFLSLISNWAQGILGGLSRVELRRLPAGGDPRRDRAVVRGPRVRVEEAARPVVGLLGHRHGPRDLRHPRHDGPRRRAGAEPLGLAVPRRDPGGLRGRAEDAGRHVRAVLPVDVRVRRVLGDRRLARFHPRRRAAPRGVLRPHAPRGRRDDVHRGRDGPVRPLPRLRDVEPEHLCPGCIPEARQTGDGGGGAVLHYRGRELGDHPVRHLPDLRDRRHDIDRDDHDGPPCPEGRLDARGASGDRTAADHRPRPVDRGLRVQGRGRAVPHVGPGRVPRLPDDDQRPPDVRVEERRHCGAVPRLPHRPAERPGRLGRDLGDPRDRDADRRERRGDPAAVDQADARVLEYRAGGVHPDCPGGWRDRPTVHSPAHRQRGVRGLVRTRGRHAPRVRLWGDEGGIVPRRCRGRVPGDPGRH